ncbi:oxidoreductase [Marivivens niveibacter]|uniref:Oxidoreductase n=1 Tax=Marivivens niveibacter TaxID=1930667 RepID=A0A251WUT4_9RHOB|nr:Gfo/Idh/MocA family oxidoreductase [Marivivens niveibacter]OUD08106.1 oxidoreductase [Marivivens niveibacter]
MKKLKLGMVGGGQGAFIGGVHRYAARLDGRFDLVAGALSSDPERAATSAAELGIERSYSDFNEMAAAESARDDGIDAVAIVTPNHMHAAPAIAFLQAGIHVICDKPLTATAEQAEELAQAAQASDAHFILTHNYTGYPLMRQARQMIADGELGQLRVIQAEYAQDWLTEASDADNKQAAWRTDPKLSGAGAIGDIGTHAFNLLSFVTGLGTQSLMADLHAFVDGRQVDDNAHIMLRMEGGARAMLWASQVAVGNENSLKLRIYGDRGGIEWEQENPNRMTFTRFGQPKQIITRGHDGNAAWTRIPGGHPEGYLEAFATIYSDAADRILGTGGELLPDINAGLDGMWFIRACQQSAQQNSVWIDR